VNNALGGIDHLLHGANRLRGWGQLAIPDPTLLTVRGFDPAANRFRYSANPQFGSTAVSRNTARQPFRITLDFRLDIGPNRETQIIRNYLEPLADGAPLQVSAVRAQLLGDAREFDGEDVRLILRRADSLSLSEAQIDSITALRSQFLSTRDSIYTDLARYLVAHADSYRSRAVRTYWHDAIASSIRLMYQTALHVRDVLTPDQLMWLRTRGLAPSLYYSPDWLERKVREPLIPR
jgi:hypothetical protein